MEIHGSRRGSFERLIPFTAHAFYSDLCPGHSHLTCPFGIAEKAGWPSKRLSILQLLFWVSLDLGSQFASPHPGNDRLLLQL